MENAMVIVIVKRGDFDFGWTKRAVCVWLHYILIHWWYLSLFYDELLHCVPWIPMQNTDSVLFIIRDWSPIMFLNMFVLSNTVARFDRSSLCLTTQTTLIQARKKRACAYSIPLHICMRSHPHIHSQNPVTHIHTQTHQAYKLGTSGAEVDWKSNHKAGGEPKQRATDLGNHSYLHHWPALPP